jgi:dTDP-4-amino-4,6-dideoxygalactose transaminase
VRTPKRDELKKHLEENQIGFGTHYEFPIHLQEAYKFLGYKKGGLPGSEKAADEVLSLPIFPELTDAEAARVVEVLNAFK